MWVSNNIYPFSIIQISHTTYLQKFDIHMYIAPKLFIIWIFQNFKNNQIFRGKEKNSQKQNVISNQVLCPCEQVVGGECTLTPV